MSHIIGRGRYARETYPRRGSAGAGGALIQCGYDQVTGEEAVAIPPVSGFFPRDNSGDPLRVTLADVVPDNFLEVDFRACMEKLGEYYEDQANFSCGAFVRFDGDPPDFSGDGNTFIIVDSSTGHVDISPSVDPATGGLQPVFNVTNLSGVIIPYFAVAAIVQIAFGANVGFEVDPDFDVATFATLKACEFAAGAIYQPGPGLLVPVEE